jgi:hypothetical protein
MSALSSSSKGRVSALARVSPWVSAGSQRSTDALAAGKAAIGALSPAMSMPMRSPAWMDRRVRKVWVPAAVSVAGADRAMPVAAGGVPRRTRSAIDVCAAVAALTRQRTTTPETVARLPFSGSIDAWAMVQPLLPSQTVTPALGVALRLLPTVVTACAGAAAPSEASAAVRPVARMRRLGRMGRRSCQLGLREHNFEAVDAVRVRRRLTPRRTCTYGAGELVVGAGREGVLVAGREGAGALPVGCDGASQTTGAD